jgi:hypothetical protein
MNIENIVKQLQPSDYSIEKDKITLLFNNEKMLILSDYRNKFMYSFFINRNMIGAGIADENEFVEQFRKYLEEGKD